MSLYSRLEVVDSIPQIPRLVPRINPHEIESIYCSLQLEDYRIMLPCPCFGYAALLHHASYLARSSVVYLYTGKERDKAYPMYV